MPHFGSIISNLATEVGEVPWYFRVAWLFAGAFLVNGVLHLVQGIFGSRFATSLASPSGVGESSAVVNVIWGFFNFAAGYVLLQAFSPPQPPMPWPLPAAALIGSSVMALRLAFHFGKRRGSAPRASPHPTSPAD